MSELLKVLKVDFEEQTVSARELYEELSGTDGVSGSERFSKWFKRFASYGFTEGIDYKSEKRIIQVKTSNSKKEYSMNLIDYIISNDMAKQICMLQKTEKGNEWRKYFIDMYKKNNDRNDKDKNLEFANDKIIELEEIIQEQSGLVSFANRLVSFANRITKGCDMIDLSELYQFCLMELGKNIIIDEITKEEIFEILNKKRILDIYGSPYCGQIEKGNFNVSKFTKNTPYGNVTFNKTLVTGKGQIKIVELLRKEFDK